MTDPMIRDRLYINGEWAAPADTEVIEVENPTTEGLAGRVPAGTAVDVNRAATAATQALPGWAATGPQQRADLIDQLYDVMTSRAAEVATLITSEMGAPTKVANGVQVGLALTNLKVAAAAARELEWEERIGNSVVLKEPVGVVGAITPWNYPLHQVTAKLGYALAAGCTVVLKPSEIAPLSTFALFDAIDEIGFPAGVVNLVTGYGPVVGEAIASHPLIDAVSFTGSTRTGVRISALAAPTIKQVSLELGGKSANVILPGADLTRAVKVGVGNAFLNSGQTCSAWTRMLVDRERYDEAIDIAVNTAAAYVTGDPFDPATRLGPLVSRQQRDRVVSYIETGVAEGARIATGGTESFQECGHFVPATIFADVTSTMTIAREEIFGPVLSIMAYDGEDDAVAIANDTVYGLSGAVWAADDAAAVAFARRVHTGQIDINGGSFNPAAPFGGYKRSGVGRELGPHGVLEFLQTKSLQFSATP